MGGRERRELPRQVPPGDPKLVDLLMTDFARLIVQKRLGHNVFRGDRHLSITGVAVDIDRERRFAVAGDQRVVYRIGVTAPKGGALQINGSLRVWSVVGLFCCRRSHASFAEQRIGAA